MAILSEAERQVVHRQLMEQLSQRRESCAITKGDLRAAVDALDQWIDDNKASANDALPAAARSGLTASQKAEILVYVIRRRWLEGV